MTEHYSHNVSDSFYQCYGCGLSVGDPALQEPCKTPDHVGQMRIAQETKIANHVSPYKRIDFGAVKQTPPTPELENSVEKLEKEVALKRLWRTIVQASGGEF